MKQNIKSFLIVIMMIITSFVTVYADNIPLEAGKQITINISLDDVTNVKGAFAFTNIDAIENIVYDTEDIDMIGSIEGNYCNLSSEEPVSGKISVTIKLKSDAEDGEIVTIAFSYKTKDAEGTESKTKISTATIETIGLEVQEQTQVPTQETQTENNPTDPLIKVTDEEPTSTGLENIEKEEEEPIDTPEETVEQETVQEDTPQEPVTQSVEDTQDEVIEETQPDDQTDVQEETEPEEEPEPEPEEEPLEVLPEEEQEFSVNIIIFVAAIVITAICTSLVILFIQRKRKNKIDNVPLVEYDIFDDDI